MAIVAVAATASASASMALSSPTISRRPFRALPRITSSISPPTHFNITFAPPSKEPLKNPSPVQEVDYSGQPHPLYIPWIVRDDNGNLTLQTSPPPRLLHALADAKTQAAKKKKIKKKEKENRGSNEAVVTASNGSSPKHSKAARRFYNENFVDSQQRLSKVLAAAGGRVSLSLLRLLLP